MSQPSQAGGSPALPIRTVRSDALILATIAEQLRVELTRPMYAQLDGDGDPLAGTLTRLYGLRDAPDQPEAVALLMDCLSHIIDLAQRMRPLADDIWTRPVNSTPSLSASTRGDGAARPLDVLLDLARTKQRHLRSLIDEPEPMVARPHDPRFDVSNG
jgi:hypothetical protein